MFLIRLDGVVSKHRVCLSGNTEIEGSRSTSVSWRFSGCKDHDTLLRDKVYIKGEQIIIYTYSIRLDRKLLACDNFIVDKRQSSFFQWNCVHFFNILKSKLFQVHKNE